MWFEGKDGVEMKMGKLPENEINIWIIGLLSADALMIVAMILWLKSTQNHRDLIWFSLSALLLGPLSGYGALFLYRRKQKK